VDVARSGIAVTSRNKVELLAVIRSAPASKSRSPGQRYRDVPQRFD
jgi:hypothetical protein